MNQRIHPKDRVHQADASVLLEDIQATPSARVTSYSAEQTLKLGQQIGKKAPPNTVIALYGELGAGKTTLIKGIVQGASGVSALEVTSPTFVTLNVYSPQAPSPKEPKTVYHFDLYRLSNVDEFLAQGFEETFLSGGICCIEWSERIAPILPKNHTALHLRHHEQNIRHIEGEAAWLF